MEPFSVQRSSEGGHARPTEEPRQPKVASSSQVALQGGMLCMWGLAHQPIQPSLMPKAASSSTGALEGGMRCMWGLGHEVGG